MAWFSKDKVDYYYDGYIEGYIEGYTEYITKIIEILRKYDTDEEIIDKLLSDTFKG